MQPAPIERLEIKLAVLEERMGALASMFDQHVKSDQVFMEQIRTDIRSLLKMKAQATLLFTFTGAVGATIGGIIATLLLKWI